MHGYHLNLIWWRWPSAAGVFARAGLLVALLAGTAVDAQVEVEPGSAEQPAELLATVRDDELPWTQRRAAAVALLDREDTEPLAVLDAVLPLLTPDRPTVHREVGARLAQRTNDDLLKALIALARDAEAPVADRQGAVLALGHQRVQQSAAVLVELTHPEQDETIRHAAFTALATLTGREQLERDREAWQRWWQEVEPLSPRQWQQHLFQALVRQRREARQHQQVLESRLVDAHRSLYRAAAVDDRPTQLMRLLEDPLEVVRQLGMDLAVQRLVDDQPFEEPLRQTLRARLDDPSATIRQRATLLLRDLADGPAADRVAHRLANAVEDVESVLRAELLMMSRLPRIEAVERSLELLAHPDLRGEAAGAINAAVAAERLTYQQGVRALRHIRRQLDAGHPPLPSIVLLLGRLGDEQDWDRIERWLDSEDDAVKQAAARAWADSDRPLLPLVERVDDPRIESIALLAAARRGQHAETLHELARYEATDDQMDEQWQRALEQMATRVPSDAVLKAVRELQQRGASRSLCQRMLTAALEQAETSSRSDAESDQAALLLARARLRLIVGEPETALEDLDRLAAMDVELSDIQREQQQRGVVRACLWLDDFDRAFEMAQAMVQAAAVGEEAISLSENDSPMDLLFEAAEQRAIEGDASGLERMVLGMRLLSPTLSTGLSQRVDLLEARVSQLRSDEQQPEADEVDATDAEADAESPGSA